MNTLKLLIADDHPIFLKGLREVLETIETWTVCAQARDGLEALRELQQQAVDVAVLDLDMPGLSGLEVAEQILAQQPDLPIILLTMHKDSAHFFRALEVGILGYVLKENAVIDVIQAIRKVSEGQAYISPDMSALLLRKTAKTVQRKPADALAQLTPAERQILELVAEFKSSKEIGDQLFISERTVNNHRMNIARKLNLTGKNGLLRFAMEHAGSSRTRP
ncbi:response regulator transcription factor [Larkinella harenae]